MIRLILLGLVLVAGAYFGPLIVQNQGYVLISLNGHALEMSLLMLVVLVIITMLLLMMSFKVLGWLLGSVSSTKGWFNGRKVRRARQMTISSQTSLREGNWAQATKLALKGATYSDQPQLNYLTAAEAAQGLGDINQRDEYLSVAEEKGDNSLAVGLTRARLQIQEGQFEQALANLQALHENFRSNRLVIDMLKQCYVTLRDWPALLALLPSLKKAKLIDELEFTELFQQAEAGVMENVATERGSEGLLSHWHSLSRKHRKDPVLLVSFAQQMIARQADDQAFIIIKDHLKKVVPTEVLGLLPQLNLADYHPVIVKLNGLRGDNQDNAVYHSTLGQLYLRGDKLEDAQVAFEQAIAIMPNPADYAFLATVLERQEQTEQAAEISKLGLNLALPGNIPNITKSVEQNLEQE